MAGLIWLGITQTNRANLLAARHSAVFQPRDQLKQNVKSDRSSNNQDDDVSKAVGVATLLILVLQCLIAGRQAGLMRRQTDIYGRQADIAEGLLDISRQQATISARQAGIMETQTALSAEALDIAIKQKEIARQAFLSAHRPILIMRSVRYTVGDPKVDPFSIQWALVNVGASNAIILEMPIHCDIRHAPNGHGDMLYIGKAKADFVLGPGETLEMEHVFGLEDFSEFFKNNRTVADTRLYGHITYRTETGRTHQVGFALRFENDNLFGRFVSTGDPEQNYSY